MSQGSTINYPDLSTLVVFFEKWKAMHPSLEEKLQAFFQKWPGYVTTEDRTSEQPVIAFGRVLSLAKFFENFPSAIKTKKRQGYGLNIWNIAGVGRDELRNMAILFWWLRPDGEHGLQGAILNGIVKMIKKEYGLSSIHNVTDFKDGYKIHREPTLWDQQGRACRLDILIESKDVLMVIEGKINAPESSNTTGGDAQLDRYCKLACDRANGKQWEVIYLTPSKRLDSFRRMKHPDLFEVTWKDVANVMRKKSKEIEKGNIIRALLESTYNSFTTF